MLYPILNFGLAVLFIVPPVSAQESGTSHSADSPAQRQPPVQSPTGDKVGELFKARKARDIGAKDFFRSELARIKQSTQQNPGMLHLLKIFTGHSFLGLSEIDLNDLAAKIAAKDSRSVELFGNLLLFERLAHKMSSSPQDAKTARKNIEDSAATLARLLGTEEMRKKLKDLRKELVAEIPAVSSRTQHLKSEIEDLSDENERIHEEYEARIQEARHNLQTKYPATQLPHKVAEATRDLRLKKEELSWKLSQRTQELQKDAFYERYLSSLDKAIGQMRRLLSTNHQKIAHENHGQSETGLFNTILKNEAPAVANRGTELPLLKAVLEETRIEALSEIRKERETRLSHRQESKIKK